MSLLGSALSLFYSSHYFSCHWALVVPTEPSLGFESCTIGNHDSDSQLGTTTVVSGARMLMYWAGRKFLIIVPFPCVFLRNDIIPGANRPTYVHSINSKIQTWICTTSYNYYGVSLKLSAMFECCEVQRYHEKMYSRETQWHRIIIVGTHTVGITTP